MSGRPGTAIEDPPDQVIRRKRAYTISKNPVCGSWTRHETILLLDEGLGLLTSMTHRNAGKAKNGLSGTLLIPRSTNGI